MEELKPTFDRVLKKILGERSVNYEIIRAINDFYLQKGIEKELFDVEVKKKYIYIRVASPYIRNEMHMQKLELEMFLVRRCPQAEKFEIRFTGRK